MSTSVKRITIGYRMLSDKCGLTVNNCKANLKSLQQKLAIETVSSYSSTMPTTYLIYDFTEIKRRREAAGLTHVIRSKGALFVDPETGQPRPLGVPVSGVPVSGVPIPGTGTPVLKSGTPGRDKTGIPGPASPIRKNNEHQEAEQKAPASSSLISTTTAQHGIPFDAAAVHQLVLGCRSVDGEATDDEIAHFIQVKLQQLKHSPRIGNWVGLLISAIPEYFKQPAQELARYRAQKGEERAEEVRKLREIVQSPDSSEAEREWARQQLTSEL